jgi:GTP-binding protein Era
MTRAGIVAVVGRPNAGKSTLLNRIVGQKLSITSPKPQSTRDRIIGIRSADDTQIILVDTPGLLDPKYALQEAMRQSAIEALNDADVILHVVDATEEEIPSLIADAALPSVPTAPLLVVLNKTDQLKRGRRLPRANEIPTHTFPISALTGDGVNDLVQAIERQLPESPFLYPVDEIGTQSLRFFVAELVRETALEQLHDEVPYSIACEVEEFREERRPVYIRVVIFVERESQKRILIGQGGAQIREIGRVARLKIEKLVDAPVYLDLWAKVLPNWRRDPHAMNRFGYRLAQEHR